MKNIIYIILVITTSQLVYSQNLVWERIMQQPTISIADYGYSYRGNALIADDKSNIYLSGEFSPNNWQQDLNIITKFNPDGNLIWEYKDKFHFYPFDTLEGAARYLFCRYLYLDQLGKLNFTGSVTTALTTNFRGKLSIGYASDDGFVSNNILDKETGLLIKEGYIYPLKYGDSLISDYGYVDNYCKVKELRNGRIAVVDYRNIIITDEIGIQKSSLRVPSLNYEKSIHSVEQTKDGGILLFYTLHTTGVYNKGKYYLVKTDSTAKFLWSKLIESTTPRTSAAAREMPNGDIAMMGYYGGKKTDKYFQNAELIMLNKDGDSLWSKSYSSKNKEALSPEQMKVTKEGNLIICGGEVNFNPTGNGSNYENDWDIWLMKLDKNGNEQWQTSRKNIDSFDYANDVIIDKNGDYIVTGYINWTTMYIGKYKDSIQSGVKEAEEKETIIEIKQEKDQLIIKNKRGEKLGIINMEIIDELGKRITITSKENNENKIYDISNLRTGIYFATWQEKGETKTKKIMIQR